MRTRSSYFLNVTSIPWFFLLTSLLIPTAALCFPADFDGDGKNDLVVYRPPEGNWYVFPSTGSCPPCFSSYSGGCVLQYGLNGDIPISGDYDGDGRADATVYRPSNKKFWIKRSNSCVSSTVRIGTAGDRPDEADFTGDGKSDIVLWRSSNSTWYIRNSAYPYAVTSYYRGPYGWTPIGSETRLSNNYTTVNGSLPELAHAIPGYFQQGDIFTSWIYIPPGLSVIQQNIDENDADSDLVFLSNNYGGYGTNQDDFVTWKQSTGVWTIRDRSGYPVWTTQWGLSIDIPVSGKYDSDSLADETVFRNSYSGGWGGTWFIKPSSGSCPSYTTPITGGCYKQWGLPGDIPVG